MAVGGRGGCKQAGCALTQGPGAGGPEARRAPGPRGRRGGAGRRRRTPWRGSGTPVGGVAWRGATARPARRAGEERAYLTPVKVNRVTSAGRGARRAAGWGEAGRCGPTTTAPVPRCRLPRSSRGGAGRGPCGRLMSWIPNGGILIIPRDGWQPYPTLPDGGAARIGPAEVAQEGSRTGAAHPSPAKIAHTDFSTEKT